MKLIWRYDVAKNYIAITGMPSTTNQNCSFLQEKTGVKMVMIQDSNVQTAFDKPLRITGDQMKCVRAKEMVLELLASKDNDMVGFDMVCTHIYIYFLL